MTTKVYAIYAKAKLALEKHGRSNTEFLLRWAAKIAKAIGHQRMYDAIEQKRLMTWVQLQRLNGAKHVTLELTYLGRRYHLVKNLSSNEKWTAQ